MLKVTKEAHDKEYLVTLVRCIMNTNYQVVYGTHCSSKAIEPGIPEPVVEFRDPVLLEIVSDP